jgi:hypothetical protein
MLNLEDLEHTPNGAVREKWCTVCKIGEKTVHLKNSTTPIFNKEGMKPYIDTRINMQMNFQEFKKEFETCADVYRVVLGNEAKITELKTYAKILKPHAQTQTLKKIADLQLQNKNLTELILRSEIFKLKTLS